MESSSVNGLCRCCASQGAFKDIKTSYHWMGEEEVYSDMLRECFDVNLTSVEQGGICELCITQLRNASNFKKQVLQTETQFKQHLQNKGFKPVKEELSVFDDNDSDDNDMDNGDDEDYVPDYEVPIKTESESEEKPSKKRGAKSASTRSKKSKSSDGDAAVKSKRHLSGEEEYVIEWRSEIIQSKINSNDRKDFSKQLHNLRNILSLTNATPIRRHAEKGYQCCYCNEQYEDPKDLKIHTTEAHDHNTKLTLMKKGSIHSFLVKLDITALECRLCGEAIDGMDELYQHLIDHDTKIYTNMDSYILPFKFEKDILTCIYCKKEFSSFLSLQTHMNSHFGNYECSLCGAVFPNRKMANSHANYTHSFKSGSYRCSYCPMTFETNSMKRNHETHEHKVPRSYKCGYCDKVLLSHDKRKLHLKKEHGIQKRMLDCNACDKKFSRPSLLSNHVSTCHGTEKRYQCLQCEKSFYFEYLLNEHMVTHTCEKQFRCEICSKYFARKKSLMYHVRLHIDERNHKCVECGAAYLQRWSLNAHMRSKHGVK